MGLYDKFIFNETKPISTYVGAPINEAVATSKSLEEKYYQNIARAGALQTALGNINVANFDRPGYEAITKDITSALDDMAKQKDYENMGTKIGTLAAKFAGDPRVHAMQESYKNYQKYGDELSRLGVNALDFTKKDFRSWDPETGEINIFDPHVELKGDWEGRQSTVLKDLKGDAILSGLTDANRLGFLKTQQGMALTKDKVQNYIDEHGMDEYRGTREYEQQMRWLQHQNPNMSIEDADATIKDQLVSRGMAKVYSTVQNKFLTDAMAIARVRKGDDNPNNYQVRSPWVIADIEAKQGRGNTTSDDLDKIYGMAPITENGMKLNVASGKAYITPGYANPEVAKKRQEAQKLMSELGNSSEVIRNYSKAKDIVKQQTTNVIGAASEVGKKLEALHADGFISDSDFNILRKTTISYLDNPTKVPRTDTKNIMQYGAPGPVSGKFKTNLAISKIADSGLRDEIDNLFNTMYTGAQAAEEANRELTKLTPVYNNRMKTVSKKDAKRLKELSEFLSPKYDDYEKIGQAINDFSIGIIPDTGGDNTTYAGDNKIVKVYGIVPKIQYEARFTKGEQDMLEREGAVKQIGDNVQIRHYRVLPNDEATKRTFDQVKTSGTKLDNKDYKAMNIDRQFYTINNQAKYQFTTVIENARTLLENPEFNGDEDDVKRLNEELAIAKKMIEDGDPNALRQIDMLNTAISNISKKVNMVTTEK